MLSQSQLLNQQMLQMQQLQMQMANQQRLHQSQPVLSQPQVGQAGQVGQNGRPLSQTHMRPGAAAVNGQMTAGQAVVNGQMAAGQAVVSPQMAAVPSTQAAVSGQVVQQQVPVTTAQQQQQQLALVKQQQQQLQQQQQANGVQYVQLSNGLLVPVNGLAPNVGQVGQVGQVSGQQMPHRNMSATSGTASSNINKHQYTSIEEAKKLAQSQDEVESPNSKKAQKKQMMFSKDAGLKCSQI